MNIKPHLHVSLIHENDIDSSQLEKFITSLDKAVIDIRPITLNSKLAENVISHSSDAVLLHLGTKLQKIEHTCRQLKAINPDLPVIAIEETPDDKLEEELIGAGIDEVLPWWDMSRADVARAIWHTVFRLRSERHLNNSNNADPVYSMLLGVLDRFPLGVIFVEGDCHVSVLNDMASNIVKLKDGLLVDSTGRCKTAVASQTAELVQHVSNLHAGEGDENGEFIMVLERPSRKQPLSVIGVGIGNNGEKEQPAFDYVALFVADPEVQISLAPNILKALFGLTRAEARLAQGLAQGHQIDVIANDFDVSIHTIRSQLKDIFQKTNTRRQSELVIRLLTSPAAITGSTHS